MNDVESRGRADGCANTNDESEQQQQQQRSTGIKFKRQWRRSKISQLQRRQWMQQVGQQEEGRW